MKTAFKTLLTEQQLRQLIREELKSVISGEDVNIGGDNESGFITIDQAVEYLKMSKSAIYKLTMSGDIPKHKKGRRLLFVKSELAEWVKSGMDDSKE
ncbi:helix-turn-helix domain-containing protein [Mucilaginibacter sp. UR6-11]|uniref:helix-turn-helix domain-containing protein n=1 Tax=Mucilaginibacter sp. UR6-11 TaxID=1435644 RepID=UPI001E38318D|nr:helix-turn-helix domain-containing protein [Mucilaginibacter sp. UR6-11]MCC8426945.1 helix-turn-helix domain-containing protein [Mucilaginibacter sp. UR6-11]